MAALVQGYPQQSGTATMLQARPSSASGVLQNAPAQATAQHGSGSTQRNSIHGFPSTSTTTPAVYRSAPGPVQPYAFTSTPSLHQTTQWQRSRAHRASSSPAVPSLQTLDYLQPAVAHPTSRASASMTNLASAGLQTAIGARDDFGLPAPGTKTTAGTQARPSHANGTPRQPSVAPAAPARPPPERYRRSALRAPDSAGPSAGLNQQAGSSAPANALDQTSTSHWRLSSSSPLNVSESFVHAFSGSAVDDMGLPRGQAHDGIKRARRRSMPAWDSQAFSLPLTPHEPRRPEESARPKSADRNDRVSKAGSHSAVDKGSNDGQPASPGNNLSASGRKPDGSLRPSSSANRSANQSVPTSNPTPSPAPDQAGGSQDSTRPVNIPPRSSSSDAANAKRVANPSPLSKPVTMDTEREKVQTPNAAESAVQNAAAAPRPESPAAQKLAAINEKGGKVKSKTSRLRRAFSFGSAAEFRKVMHDGGSRDNAQGKLHKERNPDDAYDEEQARIAQQQEAAGIGSNIYSGGRFFSSSTDNLSISSTASSASIMIRKMGRGMKKSTRSFVGLFRPKSAAGAPVPEANQPETTKPALSMVTAEAERERVNVNPDPRAQARGGTGFPRLERNSIDAAKVPSNESERGGSSETDRASARKSIVGGDKERAEVLAAVRKGILKNRNGSSSPSPRPAENKGSGLDPPSIPHAADSPSSSAPSTPNEESQGHKRAGTVAIGSEDYFVSALRLRQDSKSPGTPQGTVKRNATFSPRIVFFETWPSQEYDRRGDIATCNRLTPMLAQQIKEELNNFKMEMEVHENSKIYTHFF